METACPFSESRLEALEELYSYYNDSRFVHPDPLEFVLRFERAEEQEIAGLVASSLAYGRVASILKSVGAVLEPMGESPRAFLLNVSGRELEKLYGRFRHRFTGGDELTRFLLGTAGLLKRYGSLKEAFRSKVGEGEISFAGALARFAAELARLGNFTGRNSLLADPALGSACKRLFLYLRWMVRFDRVDPGPWRELDSKHLLVPLDTHMHRVSRRLGLTDRGCANIRTAGQITASLSRFCPEDPVKYDFALTRPGIRREAFINRFFERWESHGEKERRR